MAAVTIIVHAMPDPPQAGSDSFTTPVNTAVTVTAPGVLANDQDPDSATLTTSC